jgi:DNA polymerase III epsilon subunit-like protein
MKYYVVIDLEWTSWRNNYYGKFLKKEKRKVWQKKEIIQIGAIKFNQKYQINKKLNIYVRPAINEKLSKYIVNLTSITDKILKLKGVKFPVALDKLRRFTKGCFVFSNGPDSLILKKNFLYNRINAKEIKIFDVKPILKNKYNIPQKFLHSPMLKSFFGYKINKKKMHNALYDCQSILFSLKKMNFDFKIFDSV